VPKKSDFWEKSDFSNCTQGAQEIRAQEILWEKEIRFLRKIGFLKPPKKSVPKKSDF
jgi:hypothetical protein